MSCIKYNTDSGTDEDEDDCFENKGPSHGGFFAIDTAMMWYVRQRKCCSPQLFLIKQDTYRSGR